MQLFTHNIFGYQTEYPQSGQRIQLGNSYQFDVASPAPDQRIFRLTFSGMHYGATHQALNMTTLEAFYLAHKLDKEFNFDHPNYGRVVCKFNEPLKIPRVKPGGYGILDDFEISLIEIP